MDKIKNIFFSRLNVAIYCLIFFHLGAIVAIGIHYVMGYDENVGLSFDIGSFGSVALSALLALHVTTVLRKKQDENRYIKDLSIKRLQNLEEFTVQKVRDIIKNPNFHFVTKVTNNLRMMVSQEIEIIKENNIIEDDCAALEDLNQGLFELWDLFSGDQGDVTFNAAAQEFIIKTEVEDVLFEKVSLIKRSIFRVQIAINKN